MITSFCCMLKQHVKPMLFLAITLSAIMYGAFKANNDPVYIRWLIIVAAIALLMTSFKYALPSGCLYIILYGIISYESQFSSLIVVFIAPVIVCILSHIKGLSYSIPVGLALWYVGSINLFEGDLLPHDWIGSSILFSLFGASIATEVVLRKATIKSEDEKEKLLESRDRERLAMTRTLHDRVATSLTSCILRLEEVLLSDKVAPEEAKCIRLAINDSKSAMKEVRTLINFFRQENESHPESSTQKKPTIFYIQSSIDLLQQHGFRTQVQYSNLPPNSKVNNQELLRIAITEITVNALKYAAPKSCIDIQAEFSSNTGTTNLLFSNDVAVKQSDSSMTSGFGLEDLQFLFRAAGGNLSFHPRENRWSVGLSIN